MNGGIVQIALAVEFDPAHHGFVGLLGGIVGFGGLDERVGKGVEPHMGDDARLAAGGGLQHTHAVAHGDHVAPEPVVHGQHADGGGYGGVRADEFADESIHAQPVGAPPLGAHGGRGEEGQARGVVALSQTHEDLLGNGTALEAVNGENVAVPDLLHRLPGGNDFAHNRLSHFR